MLNVPFGQSHQLSTGAVKKPTSPVGFFTPEICPVTGTNPECLIVFSSYIILMRIPLRIGVNDMPTQTVTRNTGKRSTNVYLTAALVDKARSLDMNLSATLDTLLAREIEAKSMEREKEKEDMQSMNQFMEKAGMLTDDDFFGSL